MAVKHGHEHASHITRRSTQLTAHCDEARERERETEREREGDAMQRVTVSSTATQPDA